MEDKERKKRVLVGFIVGFIFGSGTDYLGLLLFNLAIPWTGKEPIEITFGYVFPMVIIFGLGMGLLMMNPPFGDWD